MTGPAPTKASALPFEPKHPGLIATVLCSAWVAVLSWPVWTGKLLGSDLSDQVVAGYGFRHWAAEQWRTTGEIPLWNPEIMGGLPFVGALHGDIFYPTAWLRLILPTGMAMSLGFVVHYVLAGLFAYLFLRAIRVAWSGAVVGALAYQLSGVVATYVSPGHDGKLFVTALFPLALYALVVAMRQRRFWGYPLLAVAVGLGLLSPHPQMLYYMLVASGLFALYLAFGEPGNEPLRPRVLRLAGALGAVIVGFGIGAIQIVPFLAYLPFSPRAEGVKGWAYATSYPVQWHHVPELVLGSFVGSTPSGTYWGANGLKLHSEYLGLPVIALAVCGALAAGRRQLVWWMGGIGGLFLLVSLGAGTPFYRLWYAVMPFMKSVRAPGMALFVVAFVVAVWAALGVERLERREGKSHVTGWFVVAGAVAVLALAGLFGTMAESLAIGVEQRTGYPMTGIAQRAAGPIRIGALASAAFLVLTAGVAWGWLRGKVDIRVVTIVIASAVGTDLFVNARPFWRWVDAERDVFATDSVVSFLREQPLPFRVANLGGGSSPYSGTKLMAYGIPELVGHHGNELDAFDKLLARDGQSYPNETHPHIWRLYGVRYLLLPSAQSPDSVSGFTRVMANVPSATGVPTTVFAIDDPTPYAWMVTGAIQVGAGDLDRIPPTVLDARFPLDRVVVLDTTAHTPPPPLDSIPAAPETTVEVTAWEPGAMRLRIEPAAPAAGYVVVAENWYKNWVARVDGADIAPVRGNGAVLTIPVAAGAREIELRYASPEYGRGKMITVVALLVLVASLVGPPLKRRREAA